MSDAAEDLTVQDPPTEGVDEGTTETQQDTDLLGDDEGTMQPDGSVVDADGVAHPPKEEDSDPAERPEWLPEKFKTPEDLVKAYNELGGKLREKAGPKVPEKYEVEFPEGLDGEISEEDEAFFKEAGLSNDQAQKVVEYLATVAVPELQEASKTAQLERLGREWDMAPDSQQFKDRLAAVRDWAGKNLPESVVQNLRTNAQGVSSLYAMMEAKMGAGTDAGAGHGPDVSTEAELNKLVEDPRYGQDESYTRMVEQKFQQVYDR